MHSTLLIFLVPATLISCHILNPRQVYTDSVLCIAPSPPLAFLAASAELKALDRRSYPKLDARDLDARGGHNEKPLKIETYFHVLAKNKTEAGGWLSKGDIKAQIQAIENSYVPANFHVGTAVANIKFDVKDVTWNIHSNFTFGGNFEAYLPIKKRIRRGGYKTLNLYFPWVLAEDFPRGKGFCNFPTNITNGSDDFYNDGCMIDISQLPGRSYYVRFTNETYLQEGLTAVHEIGHWFGLTHTFGDDFIGGETGDAFNCTGAGDFIADTPAHSRPSGGCNENWEFLRDTCPNEPGLDPWENHMNYSFDPCKSVGEGFTPLQIKRMKEMYKRYRG